MIPIEAEDERMADCAPQDIERNTVRPMRALGEEMMDQRDIETGRVSIDLVMPTLDYAAGDNGVGHWSYPRARLPLTMPRSENAARVQRRQTCRGC